MGALDNLGSIGGMVNYFSMNNMFSLGIILIKVVIVISIFFAIYWFVIRPMTYRINIIILAKRGDKSLVVGVDRGKIKKKAGEQILILLRRREVHLPPPNYSDLLLSEGGKSTYFLYKYGENNFAPVNVHNNFNEKSVKFYPIDSDINNWVVDETHKKAKKHMKAGFLEKYAGHVVFITAMGIILVIIWMTLGKVGEISASLNGAAEIMKQGMTAMGKCTPQAANW